MRTLLALLFLATTVIGQDGIPSDIGDGVLPPGLKGVTDINAIRQSRVEALQRLVEARQSSNMSGVDDIALLCSAQIELLIAKRDSTAAKTERLKHIEAALRHAMTIWQRVKKLQDSGMRGGEAAVEARARATVFQFREMWLTENATTPEYSTDPEPSFAHSANMESHCCVEKLGSQHRCNELCPRCVKVETQCAVQTTFRRTNRPTRRFRIGGL